MDPFPVQVSGSEGINKMVCGGVDVEKNYLDKCWHLQRDGTWSIGEPMTEKKRSFTLSMVGKEIFAVGGQNNERSLATVEKYSVEEPGGWLQIKNAPRKIFNHCTVVIDDNVLFVIGGQQREFLHTPYMKVKVHKLGIIYNYYFYVEYFLEAC